MIWETFFVTSTVFSAPLQYLIYAQPLRAPSVGANALVEGIRVIAVLQLHQLVLEVYSCCLPINLSSSPTQVSRHFNRGRLSIWLFIFLPDHLKSFVFLLLIIPRMALKSVFRGCTCIDGRDSSHSRAIFKSPDWRSYSCCRSLLLNHPSTPVLGHFHRGWESEVEYISLQRFQQHFLCQLESKPHRRI